MDGTHSIKLLPNFRRFDGLDLRSWVDKCDQFYDVDEKLQGTKVKLAAVRFE